MSKREKIDVYAAHYIDARDGDDYGAAVMLKTGRMTAGLSVAEARELSLRMAQAADEAEERLQRSPADRACKP